MTTPRNRHPRLEAFLSLEWYEVTLRFIATFVAKTSELLLAAGLVVSSANFLTDGNVLQAATASQAWAWAQALAIDSSLAISFYYVLQCLKQRDWIKLALYSLLTLLLALVAGTITNIDIYSHAIHSTIQQATGQLGIDIQVLSTLRAVAVVGFVLMSRLRDVAFKDLYLKEQHQPASREKGLVSPEGQDATPRLTVEEVASLLHVVVQQKPSLAQETLSVHAQEQSEPLPLLSQPQPNIAIARLPEPASSPHTKEVEQQPPLSPSTSEKHISHEPTKVPVMKRQAKQAKPHADEEQQYVLTPEQNERLEQAYNELQTQGKRVSGRALAQLAHIHRSTCNAWLEARQEEESHSEQKPLEPQKSSEEENSRKVDNEDA